MVISFLENDNTNNYPNDSILPHNIDLQNYEYIPLYIHKIIQICIISNILSSDIYLLLVKELYELYKKTIISYKPPILLTMSYTYCTYCNKKLENTVYSKLIDLHHGWYHCYSCENLINKWYNHYIELNFILPFEYIDNIDINIDIYYYRSRTKSINRANINIFKKNIYYNITTKKIFIPVYWNENNQSYEKWISLINILYHTNTIKTINYRIPEYWSIYTIKCWKKIFNKIYGTLDSLYELNDNELIEYFKE